MSWYLTIRSDDRYSKFAETASLIAFLGAIPELRQTNPNSFGSVEGKPWVQIMMAVCDSKGNYGNNGECLLQINVVELVCSHSGNPDWYDGLAARIAKFLGWSAIEDHEGRQVWPLPG